MATKPTVRIPLWASGGTTTDPGGGKEAAGWLVDERPPANWWNWVWNAMGQWLGWAETSIDDLETAVNELGTGRAFGLLTSNGAGGAAITYNGANLTNPTILGSAMRVDTTITFASVTQMIAIASCENNASCCIAAETVDTNTIELNGTLTSTGAVWDFSSTVTVVSLLVLGTKA